MPDTEPPPIPSPPEPARIGAGTRLATSVSSQGYGVDPDAPEDGNHLWRLALLLGGLAFLAVKYPWMFVVIMGIALMITLHELGHYVMAKRAGMKVTEFFLGFGPKIWSTRRGETTYGIKVIPAGAYVKIPGMVNLDEVDPADEARTYRQKSFGQRVGVAVAGSAMHFALALVLLFIALVVIGQPGGALTDPDVDNPPVVEEVIDGSGAEAAGLQPGDEILEIDGMPTPDTLDLREAVAESRGETVPVLIERGGTTQTVDVSIQAFTTEDDREVCGLGIDMQLPPNERLSPIEGLVAAPKEFAEITWLSLRGLASFFSPSGIADFASQVGSAQEDRQADGVDEPVEEAEDPCDVPASAKTTSSSSGSGEGENRILSIYGLVNLGSDVGGSDPAALIGLFALINIFIGVFNLVPLLPFDGGHVAIAVYEKIQEKRLGRRRYFTDVSRLLPLTYGVVVALGMLFVSSLYLDIVNPIGG
ncbi:MAG: site-2 protease family protein [Acidimicrobiales bacterium]|nr:site-2 protease family protein [Acidimicrobiales bacterium]